MKIRQDNRGLSLVELIIAIAVSAIIMGAVTMFIYSAHKSYKLASETIDLQIEAQLLMEQMGNWIMESNDVIVTSSAQVVGEVLVLYDIPANNGRELAEWQPVGYTAEDTDATKRVIWAKDGKLFMTKITGIENAVNDKEAPLSLDFAALSNDETNMIGELVQQFIVEYDETDAPNLIGVELIMKKGNSTYDLKNDFKIRNGM